MKKAQKYLLYSLIMFVVFGLYTFCLTRIDVKPIGPFFSKVGFATLNDWVRDMVGHSSKWYDVSQVMGYLALAVCGCFVVFGFYQLATGKKGLAGVSRGVWATAGLYIVLAGLYYFFDNVLVINYRPVLGEQSLLEPSYPSSHTLLAVCVFLAASDQIGRQVDNRFLGTMLSILCWLAAIATVVSRFLSGVHWVTDIIGSLILSSALICLYLAVAGEKK